MRPMDTLPTDDATACELAAALACARSVVAVTGAGVSAASGLATYRSTSSAWNDPHLERISHASRYGNHLPELWRHWSSLRAAFAAAEPNPAHLALAELEQRLVTRGGRMLLATQNVDGLHTRAGSNAVIELHGALTRSRCIRRSCGRTVTDPKLHTTPPRCSVCGKQLRADVVLFGERLARRDRDQVTAAIRTADVLLYVGTSGQVAPVNGFVREARRDATVALVNGAVWDPPEPAFTHTLLGPAERLLPALLASPR